VYFWSMHVIDGQMYVTNAVSYKCKMFI
jgi:hypothetical protein